MPNSYRVTHARDPIVTTPIYNPNLYFHHRQEIHYPGNMTAGAPYIVCQRAEDPKCSDGSWDFSMDDHRHYFEMPVPTYCDSLAGS